MLRIRSPDLRDGICGCVCRDLKPRSASFDAPHVPEQRRRRRKRGEVAGTFLHILEALGREARWWPRRVSGAQKAPADETPSMLTAYTCRIYVTIDPLLSIKTELERSWYVATASILSGKARALHRADDHCTQINILSRGRTYHCNNFSWLPLDVDDPGDQLTLSANIIFVFYCQCPKRHKAATARTSSFPAVARTNERDRQNMHR